LTNAALGDVTAASGAVTGASASSRPVGARYFPAGQQYLTLANGERIPIMMGLTVFTLLDRL